VATVDADAFADISVFTGGLLNGTLSSTAGSVSVFSGDDANLVVHAGQHVSLVAFETLFTDVTADGDISVFSGASLFAALSAGGSAAATSLGPMGVIINAAFDASVYSIGNAWAVITAGRDTSLVGYGDMLADIKTGDDVTLLWNRGTLVAHVLAGDVVEWIETYSETLLDIEARGVDWIQSWGAIDGEVDATDYIGPVYGGVDITATFDAPEFAGASAHYKPLFLASWPDTPDVSLDALRASIRNFRRSLTQLRDDLDANALGLGELIRAAQASADHFFDPSLGDPRSAAPAVQNSAHQLVLALAQAKDADIQALLSAKQQLKQAIAQLTASAAEARARDELTVVGLRRDGNIFAAELELSAEVRQQLSQLERAAKQIEREVQAVRFAATNALWPTEFRIAAKTLLLERINFVVTVVLDVLQTIADFVGLVPYIGDVVDVVNGVVYLMRGRWLDASFSLVSALSFCGVGYAGNAARWAKYAVEGGSALWAVGRKLTKYGDDVIDAAQAGARAVDKVDDVCALGRTLRNVGVPPKFLNYLGIGCFEAGTLVLTQPEDPETADATADSPWPLWAWSSVFVGIAIGGHEVIRRFKKRQARRKAHDEVFAEIADGSFRSSNSRDEFAPESRNASLCEAAWDDFEAANKADNAELDAAIAGIAKYRVLAHP
jgi:hypothetical protein